VRTRQTSIFTAVNDQPDWPAGFFRQQSDPSAGIKIAEPTRAVRLSAKMNVAKKATGRKLNSQSGAKSQRPRDAMDSSAAGRVVLC